MEDYKQYLSESPDDSEREAAKGVLEGLAGLRLENKVAQVAAERQNWLRRRFLRRLLWAGLLTLGLGAVIWQLNKPRPTNAPLPVQLNDKPVQQEPVAQDDKRSIETPNAPKDPSGPIAQIRPSERLPEPRFPAPNIRGENQDNTAWKALLDQVWYTDYPPASARFSGVFAEADQFLKARDFSMAYVKLQRLERKMPENDTLRYLKGYCLLEMGEGAESLRYLESLQGKAPAWDAQLQWYQGLGQLITGDKKKALTTFRKISANPKHPYRAQGERAVRLLE